MKINDKQITIFFSAYEKRINNALAGKNEDLKGSTDSFAEYIVEAHPAGVIGAKNDKKFAALIKKGNKQYKAIGTQSMKIEKKNIVYMNDQHAMVQIHWLSYYEKKDGTQVTIDFDVWYFVQLAKRKIKIFSYVTGDEQAALKKHGLI